MAGIEYVFLLKTDILMLKLTAMTWRELKPKCVVFAINSITLLIWMLEIRQYQVNFRLLRWMFKTEETELSVEYDNKTG